MSILNRIRFTIQHSKRREMLNRYGFYKTVETQRGILICTNGFFGVERLRSKYTTFHIHTMLDCPFLIKPRYEDETEYSCYLVQNDDIYNIPLKELIDYLENRYIDCDSNRFLKLLDSDYYHCKCMEWTQYIP